MSVLTGQAQDSFTKYGKYLVENRELIKQTRTVMVT